MAYFSPFIDPTGLHIPIFQDIQNNLISQAKTIFGQDIYLDNDSQDKQYIAAIASAIYDTMQLCQLAVNNQSPQTAIGTGLDSIVKLNGLKRLAATYSTCFVTCTGISGTIIPAGVVRDTAGDLWNLPPNTVIPSGGVLSVYATCQTPGNIVADAGTIQTIATPQYGWLSVSNVVAATPGVPLETDQALRFRQAKSVALPAQTILNGILGSVLNIDGVVRAVAYENTASGADSKGIPGHSISIVVEGGSDQDIADQIYARKTPGCGTYGTTTVNKTSKYGFVTPVSFFRPALAVIDISVSVKSLSSYSDAITSNIKTYIVDYLNSLQIGEDVIVSSLWGAALQAQPNIKSPAFSITGLTAAKHGGALSTNDIAIAFNESAHGMTENITVTVS